MKHLFLTGEPGVGKSTIVNAVCARLATAVDAVGFLTVEQRDQNGQRVGFRSINVADREDSVQLASLGTQLDGHRIGQFTVHLDEASIFCRRVLSLATEGPRPRLCFLDEVGAMQLLSPELEQLFGRVVDGSGGCCFGTLPPKGLHQLPFVERLRARSDVTVLEVTKENRNELIDMAYSMVCRLCFPPQLAESIEAKAALAKRYSTELGARVEWLDDPTAVAVRFTGEHGSYEMRRGLREGDAFDCTCPFFSQHGTCSHTLALAFERERRERAGLAPPAPGPQPAESQSVA